VRELAHAPHARIAVFTAEAGVALEEVARETGAEAMLRAASTAVERVAAQIAPILHDVTG
jgi:hypothetical protein